MSLTKLAYFFDPITQVSQLIDHIVEELGLEIHRKHDIHAETWNEIMRFLAGHEENTEKPTR